MVATNPDLAAIVNSNLHREKGRMLMDLEDLNVLLEVSSAGARPRKPPAGHLQAADVS
jgi:hypothetical protein